MKWVILLVGVVVICFVAALILGLVGGSGMGRATSSLHHEPLPDDALTEDDLAGIEFDVTARGYRMSQVDGVVDRLRRELRQKDEEIAVLRAEDAPPPAQSANADRARAESREAESPEAESPEAEPSDAG